MKKEEAIEIVQKLKKYYPDAKCSLDFKTPFELVIAVMLSAQCTDERVNKTTPHLFEKYSTPEQICNMEQEELEKIIYPCGFYKNKAKNIKAMAKEILEKYNGKVPQTMEELTNLPGVGRKSANVIMLEAFGNPQGIAIDTHAKRILNRLGISKNTVPTKIEQDILKIIPKEYYKDVNHLLVWHGRITCDSRKPKCEKCPIRENCNWKKCQWGRFSQWGRFCLTNICQTRTEPINFYKYFFNVSMLSSCIVTNSFNIDLTSGAALGF